MTIADIDLPVRKQAAPQPPSWERRRVVGVYVCMAIFLIAYATMALVISATRPLWLDEVLSAWVARLPTAHDIVSAHFHGSEYAPPTYNLFLHYLITVAGDNYTVLRAPALLATIGTGICLFILLRRTLGIEIAALGMVCVLLGTYADFAVQVRPYALVTACFALATLLWRDIDSARVDYARTAGISALLILAFSIHFYATLFIPCFGIMELLWSMHARRIRILSWIGLFIAGIATLLWLPLISALSGYNHGDALAPGFYAKPTLLRLELAYLTLAVAPLMLKVLLPVSIVSLSVVLSTRYLNLRVPDISRLIRDQETIRLEIILISSAALPLIIFVFSLLVTKTFNLRYCLVGSLGLTGGLVWVLGGIRGWSLALFPVMCVAIVMCLYIAPDAWPVPLELFTQATEPLPIVVGEGLLYFELVEAAPVGLRQRFVYVNRPTNTQTPDPTNENLVDRWQAIRPDLKIFDAKRFFAENRRFYIVHSNSSTDVLTPWLQRHNLLDRMTGRIDDETLYIARAPSQNIP